MPTTVEAHKGTLWGEWYTQRCLACRMDLFWPCRCKVRLPYGCRRHNENSKSFFKNGNAQVCSTCRADPWYFADWGNIGG